MATSEPDTTRWDAFGEFPLLDFMAKRRFMSASSVSFGFVTRIIYPEGGEELHGVGELELHHPCAGHFKAIIRVCLPDHYFSAKQMDVLARELLERLGIAGETFQVHLTVPGSTKKLGVESERNPRGMGC